MAKETPTIETAKQISKLHAQDVVILITAAQGGRLTMVTYGRTKNLCEYAKRLGDLAFNTLINRL